MRRVDIELICVYHSFQSRRLLDMAQDNSKTWCMVVDKDEDHLSDSEKVWITKVK